MTELTMEPPADFIVRTQASLRYLLLRSAHGDPTHRLSRALRLAIEFMGKIKIGSVDLILPDGRKFHFQGKQKGPHGSLTIHNERVVRKFLLKGKLGFHESYLDGDWSSPNMATFFDVILRNEHSIKENLMGKSWMRALEWIGHLVQPNTKSGSRKNIYHHYDIGNDFYGRWLDPSMTYSSALFSSPDLSLEQAQRAKYQRILDQLQLKGHEHILEIGCGWGGFAHYAAEKFPSIKITAITISQAQYDYACQRLKQAGHSNRVEIILCDYRDIAGQFDHIVSIEMFEAVGEKYWPTYFSVLQEKLKSQGKAVLQIITINEKDFPAYRRTADYIQKYIFPGGMLPTLPILKDIAIQHGLKTQDMFHFGSDYARTLEMWNKKFQSAWPDIEGTRLDQRFKRLWEQYFAYCQAGFSTQTIDVIHHTVQKM
jgi:cyclopropane-fatty-acyl-phospholipid synthase